MNKKILDEILLIIKQEVSDEMISRLLDDYHEADIASVLKHLDHKERLDLYKKIGLDRSSEIFTYLEDVEEFLDELAIEAQADIIEKMDVDDATDVLEELSASKQEDILKHIEDNSLLENLNLIKNYEKDLVGSLMTSNYIKISKDLSIKEAMKEVIKQAEKNDNVSIIFTIDEASKYFGLIDLRDLIIARPDDSLQDLIKTSYPVLYDTQDIGLVISDLLDYSLEVFPVLKEDKTIIGALTSSDISESLEDELNEDYLKFAGLSDTDDLSSGVLKSVKKRIPWLITLLFLGLFVSFIASNFEGIVRSIPMIVFFQSLVIGMGGNAGTQSLAVTIRLISDEDVSNFDLVKTVFKEFKVGFFNGLFLSVISSVIVFLFIYITKTEIIIGSGYNNLEALETSIVVGLSLLISISLSTLIGSVVPIIFSKLKIDPAVASGPFITTLNDLIGIVIYYVLAYYFLIVLV